MTGVTPALERELVQGELFDLTLYRRMRTFARGDTAAMLDELIAVETRHLAFWQDFFAVPLARLTPALRLKLAVMTAIARLFGESGIHLLLEPVEIYGIRKYLAVWDAYKDHPLRAAVSGILRDEFEHEDHIVSSVAARKIHPEHVRDLFLGFNDGLIEVVGAISGFFAVFATASAVLAAGLTVAVAGSLSMSAGAFAAVGSEKELESVREGKERFLGRDGAPERSGGAFASALVVGVSYFVGALVPLLPVFFGAENLLLSLALSGAAALLVSYVVAFLSGMNVGRRIGINVAIILIAVSVTYGLGFAAKQLFGVHI